MENQQEKIKNFQETFSIEDIKIALDVSNTYNCGMSRVALRAASQTRKVIEALCKLPNEAKSSSMANVNYMTLKFYYAVMVWCKAALISSYEKDTSADDISHYWSLDWKDNKTPFREIFFIDTDENVNQTVMVKKFWELLEKIANSGAIYVCEGCYVESEKNEFLEFDRTPSINCRCIMDRETAEDCYRDMDIFNYKYNIKKTYKWNDIKDFFIELTLDQLRLTMPEDLHKPLTVWDQVMMQACSNMDYNELCSAIANGANVNAIDRHGNTAMQYAVSFFTLDGQMMDETYSDEQLKQMRKTALSKCLKIVDYLLDNGASIDLFGYEGVQPLLEAYYAGSVEMVQHLLERGSNPNFNSFLTDYYGFNDRFMIRCSVLDLIADSCYIDDETMEMERKIDSLVCKYGGHIYVWGYNPCTMKTEGKFFVGIFFTNESRFYFEDADGEEIGDIKSLTVEDSSGKKESVKLPDISGLEGWINELKENRTNLSYDWNGWRKRGLNLAKEISRYLPSYVTFYYLSAKNPLMVKSDSSDSLDFNYWHEGLIRIC